MKESAWIALFWAALLRPLALSVFAVVAIRLFRLRHPASQHAIWTLVLVGMLVVPFLSVSAPHWDLPLLPAKVQVQLPARPQIGPQLVAPISTSIPAELSPQLGHGSDPRSLEKLAFWLYLAGALAMALRSALGGILARRVVRRSRRLRSRVRESVDIVAPVAAGLWRPAVLLPTSWREWNAETRAAVLAHEFAHIRRADAWTALLARLAVCLFWFHPLTWWLSRKIGDLAELACDVEALDRVGDPAAYSRILVQFAAKVVNAGHRAALPGLAMADSSRLGSRIDQVFEISRGDLRRLNWPVAWFALVGLPAICMAATLGLRESKPRVVLPAREPAAAQPAPSLVAQTPEPPPGIAPRLPAAPSAPGLEPRFEKATLGVAGPPVTGELCWGGCGGPGTPYPESQNEITYRHFPLKKILMRAYDVEETQISIPASLESAAYDLQATAPVGVSKQQFQLMLRNLLIERVHLAMHHETQVFVTGYDLVVAPDGPKLPPAQEGSITRRGEEAAALRLILVEGGPLPVGSRITPMAAVAAATGFLLRSRVADKTGLTGEYLIDYDNVFASPASDKSGPIGGYAIDPAKLSGINVPKPIASTPASLGQVRAGLGQLGLALMQKTEEFDVLIVDRADETPLGN